MRIGGRRIPNRGDRNKRCRCRFFRGCEQASGARRSLASLTLQFGQFRSIGIALTLHDCVQRGIHRPHLILRRYRLLHCIAGDLHAVAVGNLLLL